MFWSKQKFEKGEEGNFYFFKKCFVEEEIELLLIFNICKVEVKSY